MKTITLFFLMFLLVSQSNRLLAQKKGQVRIDSLLSQLPTQQEDTLKLKLLINIINTYLTFQPEAGLKYENQALHLAEKLNWQPGVLEIKNQIGWIYWRLGKFENALQHHSEALKIQEALVDNYALATGNWKGAYKNYKQYIAKRDSIFKQEITLKMSCLQMQYNSEKEDVTGKLEQEKKDIRRRNQRYLLFSGGLVLLLISGGLWSRLRYIEHTTATIKEEKKRSESLLLNILPEEVAEELKSKGMAQAKLFDKVTVMFTDFKGFTQITEKLSPTELVAEIDTCFKTFDHIISKYKIEKIKTIGDSYMCAGGLPVSNTTHALDVVKAGLEILQFMQHRFQRRIAEGKVPFEIRIGIHSGPVVAGIVGLKKFAYDIWGDTVNIASRMESSGETGKINISGCTHELVKDTFHCTYRGKIQAKNKGEIDMYFVDGWKS